MVGDRLHHNILDEASQIIFILKQEIDRSITELFNDAFSLNCIIYPFLKMKINV